MTLASCLWDSIRSNDLVLDIVSSSVRPASAGFPHHARRRALPSQFVGNAIDIEVEKTVVAGR